jgi:hypothetical protein
MSDTPPPAPSQHGLRPTPPELTPQQTRALMAERRARHHQAIAEAKANRTLAQPEPHTATVAAVPTGVPRPFPRQRATPRGKKFEQHEMRRVPVTVSREAHDALNAANHQARIFPQALEEAYGWHAYPHVARIDLTYELHPNAGPRLVVTIRHQRELAGRDDAPPPVIYRYRMHDLTVLHGTQEGHIPPNPYRSPGEPFFSASATAIVTAKGYPHRFADDEKEEEEQRHDPEL